MEIRPQWNTIFQIQTKPQDSIFQLAGWQRFKKFLECCISGDQGKWAYLFIGGEDVNWNNPLEDSLAISVRIKGTFIIWPSNSTSKNVACRYMCAKICIQACSEQYFLRICYNSSIVSINRVIIKLRNI